MKSRSASAEFTKLDGLRGSFMTRLEKYSMYTLPRLLVPKGVDELNTELVHDYQAVGAQATNHIANRLMLTMFAPSRPFIRLSIPLKDMAQLGQLSPEDIEAQLAEGEQQAVKQLDNETGLRAQLYEAILNLVVLGNVCIYLPKKDTAVVYNIRDYVVRRNAKGEVVQAVVQECTTFDELDDAVKAAYVVQKKVPMADDKKVTVYHRLERDGDKLLETTWVEDCMLSAPEFQGTYPLDDCPWHFLTWNLKNRAHYGTGLVEDYAGDFAALSALSKAQIEAAILASQFRWLANPNGQTRVEEFEKAENGAVLAGAEGDLTLVTNSKSGDIRIIKEIGEDYIRRIGQGFLLGSAVTRDAERVTAEEIRQQAAELETGLGGVYTRLAGTLQRGVAGWLLHRAGFAIGKTKIKLQIVTGLDALSRNGDLAALRQVMNDLGLLETIGQTAVGKELNLRAIATAIFAGNGLSPKKYLATPEQQQAAQAAEAEQMAVEAGTEAAAQQMAQQPQ